MHEFNSSGTAATTTSSDTAVDLIALNATKMVRKIVIINDGSVAGFFSLDGSVWNYMPATSATTIDLDKTPVILSRAVQVKRIPSGSNLASVYGYAY